MGDARIAEMWPFQVFWYLADVIYLLKFNVNGSHVSWVAIWGGGTRNTPRSNFFDFHAVLEKKFCQIVYMLALPTLEMG